MLTDGQLTLPDDRHAALPLGGVPSPGSHARTWVRRETEGEKDGSSQQLPDV